MSRTTVATTSNLLPDDLWELGWEELGEPPSGDAPDFEVVAWLQAKCTTAERG